MRNLPNQRGVVHIIPLILIVAAVGIISFLLISSTAPLKNGLLSLLNPKPASKAASSSGFVETFAFGAPATPMPFVSIPNVLQRWQVVAGAGSVDGLKSMGPNNDQETHGFIEEGHGPHCESPIANSATNDHILTVPMRDGSGNLINPSTYPAPLGIPQGGSHVDSDLYQQQIVPNLVYVCNNHMMTTMEAGYDIITFMPRYQLDWSGGRTQTIQWDTNVYGLGRAWYDVYIIPSAQMPMWVVENNAGGTTNLGVSVNQGGPVDTAPKDALVLSFNNGAFRPEQWSNWQYLGGPGAPQYCGAMSPSDPACGDPSIRRTFRVTFNSNTITMQIQNQNGVFMTSYSGSLPGTLPFTNAMARFSHHTYNASKDLSHSSGSTQTVFDAALNGNITANPFAWGQPYSLYTYHWANVIFDGPANPDNSAYPASPNYLDLNGAGATKTVHINVTNADIRSPMIWALANTVMQDEAGDPYNRTSWLRYRVNGGAWMSFHNIRDGAPFVNGANGDDEIDQATWNGPATGLRLGDNTIDINFDHMPTGLPWEGGYQNVHLYPIEVQVAPTSDMPPANPTGGTTPSSTPGSPGSPTPTPSTNPSATPTSTPVPVGGSVTLNFDSQAQGSLNGQDPSALVNWGTGNWFVSGPYSSFTTNSISFPNATPTSGAFTFVSPARLVSLQAANGGSVASTVTIACSGNSTVTQNVPIGQLTTINTNWTANCTGPVTITSSNGWNTNFDNFVVSAGGTSTPSPTPIADINFGGRVFNDVNGNGIQDTGEAGVANRPINVNGSLFCTTDSTGLCTRISGGAGIVIGQTYTVSHALPAGFTNTTPITVSTVAAPGSGGGTIVSFGIRQLSTPSPTPAPSCPKAALGDLDCDGRVWIFDYNTLVGNFGLFGTNLPGDLDHDGRVWIFDYNTLVGNFGQ